MRSIPTFGSTALLQPLVVGLLALGVNFACLAGFARIHSPDASKWPDPFIRVSPAQEKVVWPNETPVSIEPAFVTQRLKYRTVEEVGARELMLTDLESGKSLTGFALKERHDARTPLFRNCGPYLNMRFDEVLEADRAVGRASVLVRLDMQGRALATSMLQSSGSGRIDAALMREIVSCSNQFFTLKWGRKPAALKADYELHTTVATIALDPIPF